MLVKELIAKLQELPEDTPVLCTTDSDDPESLYVPEVHLVQDTKGNYYVIK